MPRVTISYDDARFARLVQQSALRMRAGYTPEEIASELRSAYPERDVAQIIDALRHRANARRRDPARLILESCLWLLLFTKAGALWHVLWTPTKLEGLGMVFLVLAPVADLVALALYYRLCRASYLGIALTLVVFAPAFTGFNETLGDTAWLTGWQALCAYAAAFLACAWLIPRDGLLLSVRDVLRREGLTLADPAPTQSGRGGDQSAETSPARSRARSMSASATPR